MRLEDVASRLRKAKRLSADKWIACCPAHNDRTPSLSLSYGRQQEIVWHCHAGCSQEAVGQALREQGILDGTGKAKQLSPEERAALDAEEAAANAKKTARAQGDWGKGRRIIPGSIPWVYLAWRGIDCALVDMTWLRWRWTDDHPEMIAALTDGSGEVTGIQLTRLQHEGEGRLDRKSLGVVNGSAVRLTQPDKTLALCEGIEDAFSFTLLTGIPAWACCGSVRAGVEIPDSVTTLYLAPDQDAKEKAEPLLAGYRTETRAAVLRACPNGDWSEMLDVYSERLAISDNQAIAWKAAYDEK